MRDNFIGTVFIVILITIIAALVILPLTAFVGMMCWNHSIHYLFGLPKANFWEMVWFIVFVGILKGIFSIKISKNS